MEPIPTAVLTLRHMIPVRIIYLYRKGNILAIITARLNTREHTTTPMMAQGTGTPYLICQKAYIMIRVKTRIKFMKTGRRLTYLIPLKEKARAIKEPIGGIY